MGHKTDIFYSTSTIFLHKIIFTDSFNTPSHLATEHGHAKCFNCLLQHNADLRATNARGDSPMDSAKKSGHPILMEKAGMFICIQTISYLFYQ